MFLDPLRDDSIFPKDGKLVFFGPVCGVHTQEGSADIFTWGQEDVKWHFVEYVKAK